MRKRSRKYTKYQKISRRYDYKQTKSKRYQKGRFLVSSSSPLQQLYKKRVKPSRKNNTTEPPPLGVSFTPLLSFTPLISSLLIPHPL